LRSNFIRGFSPIGREIGICPDRLGYGSEDYNHIGTILRQKGEVFACGVAYAGQDEASLPTDAYDERLDSVLTEDGFRKFI